jgi:hypothetical protein
LLWLGQRWGSIVGALLSLGQAATERGPPGEGAPAKAVCGGSVSLTAL